MSTTTRIPKGLESAEIWAHTLGPVSWKGHIEEKYSDGTIKTRRGEFPYTYRGHGLKNRLRAAKRKPINESFVIHFLQDNEQSENQ